MGRNVGRADGVATILTPDRSNGVPVLWEYQEKQNLREKFTSPAWADEKAKGAYVFPRQRFAALVHSKLESGFGARHPWDELLTVVTAQNTKKSTDRGPCHSVTGTRNPVTE